MPTSTTRRPAPSYTRPMANAQKVSPPASVQETLRSIAENAARWTDLAGVSLARSSGAEGAKTMAASNEEPAVESMESVEFGQTGQHAQGLGAIETTSSTNSNEPLPEVVEPSVAQSSVQASVQSLAQPLAQRPVEAASVESSWMPTAFDAPVEVDAVPVVQWPIEPPIIHAPSMAAPVPMGDAGGASESVAAGSAGFESGVATPDAFTPALSTPAVVAPVVSAHAPSTSAESAPAEYGPVASTHAVPAPALTTPVASAHAVSAPVESAPFVASTRAPFTSAVSTTAEYAPAASTPTPFQIFAAQLQASDEQPDESSFEDESTQSAVQIDGDAHPSSTVAQTVDEAIEPSSTIAPSLAAFAKPQVPAHREETAPIAEPRDVPAATTQPPIPVAEVVIDKALAPWQSRSTAVAAQHALAASHPVVQTEVRTEAPTAHHTPLPQVAGASAGEAPAPVQPATSNAPAVHDASEAGSTFTPVTVTTTANPAQQQSPQPLQSPQSSQSLQPAQSAQSPQSPEPHAPLPTPPTAEAPPPEPTVVQRPPLRGHAPVNGFEFHAPAASMVELPTLDLLAPADTDIEPVSEEKLIETGLLIEQRLQEFKVPVTVVGASAGPVITRFEVEPALGVRGSQIVGLMKDLSRGLGLTSIRVVETIPGKTCMGLELPNAKRQTIRLSEILEASVYQNSHSQLTLAMGKDITGHPVVADLAKAPHMLVAGTTGSGKSVAINAMICSLLYKATPEEVRLIMIDPKMLELSVYEGIPHLLAPVVTDMKLAANALNWCVGEMEKRYRLMSAVGVRNLAGFNQKIRDTEAKGKKLGNPFSLTPDAPEPLAPLPLIVVVIDELADLMMVAGKKIEELIARLAQKARAAGIHLILATQRPSVDVITGLIKANIPTRVAFQVSSKIDSRTILDQMGAESLLGQGDMLFLPPGTGYPQRVHGAFVADEEVHRIVEYLKQFGEPQYEEGILDGPATDGGAAQDLFGESPDAEADPLYDEAVAFVVRTRRASISSVQRQLRIGYNRAARLVEQMETAGLVSAMSINGSREVLAPGPAE